MTILEEAGALGEDFVAFGTVHRETRDIDPIYPVMRHLFVFAPHLFPTERSRVEFTFAYVTWYNLPTALSLWVQGFRFSDTKIGEVDYWPTGVERRGHRNPAATNAHIDSLRSLDDAFSNGLLGWLSSGQQEDPFEEWRRLQEVLVEPWGNGRWAAFKTGEVLIEANNWKAEPTDAGHKNSTGPRRGLADLAPQTVGYSIAELDLITEELRLDMEEQTGERWRVAEIETVLCDFHSMRKGGYYVGHDIDLLLAQLGGERVDQVARNLILNARSHCFPSWLLGEMQGWDGVRRDLKKLYRDDGGIGWW
jgi:hypothetical protein